MSSSRLRTGFRHAPRVLLGLVFFVFGWNGFLHFIPEPPPTGRALGFVAGLASSGYFFPLLKSTEVLAGFLLLANRFVPLGLTLLAPVVVNILAFHLFLAPSGAPMAVLLVALELVLAWFHREAFASLLTAKMPLAVASSSRASASASSGASPGASSSASSGASSSPLSPGLSAVGSRASSRM